MLEQGWDLKSNSLNMIDLTVFNSKCLKECLKTFKENQHLQESMADGRVEKLRRKILQIYNKMDVQFVGFPILKAWRR